MANTQRKLDLCISVDVNSRLIEWLLECTTVVVLAVSNCRGCTAWSGVDSLLCMLGRGGWEESEWQTDRDHCEHGLHGGDGVVPVVVGTVEVVAAHRHDPPTQRLRSHAMQHSDVIQSQSVYTLCSRLYNRLYHRLQSVNSTTINAAMNACL